jgi:hypothetical protein
MRARRVITVLLCCLLPLGATASDGSTLGPAATAPAAGGSNADATSLQPAGLAPLQSTPQDSGGLTSPTDTNLQAPVTNADDLQVLAGEADGDPQRLNGENDNPLLNWLLWSLGIAAVAAVAAAALWYRRRQETAGRPANNPPPEPESNPEPESSPESEPKPEPESTPNAEPESDAEPKSEPEPEPESPKPDASAKP